MQNEESQVLNDGLKALKDELPVIIKMINEHLASNKALAGFTLEGISIKPAEPHANPAEKAVNRNVQKVRTWATFCSEL